MKPGHTGLLRILKATGFSIQGIKAGFKHEAAIRQEFVLLAVSVIVAAVFDFDLTEKCLLVGSVIFLLIVELLNSAVEAVVDRVGSEFHELSGRAKDMGSAAVFFALVLVAMTWFVIFYSHFS
ncbi:diacylglycerol kinase [Veronia nyctiphanis]|uniref:Diacylglycerol kinase n=1 Tax=Veronia nyctiphanis TaxID=1278244 RepID=A0A4Q0YVJ7_9GAMM|nr:diacylglycerol kinase [Veronia nyctiphanis]RXJ74913.1 diacylglycerol kinase [Veronia nyctiphanis]